MTLGWSNSDSELNPELLVLADRFLQYYALKKTDDFKSAFQDFCQDFSLFLPSSDAERLLLVLENHLTSFGPLTVFLNDDSIEEIAVTGLSEKIFVFKKKTGWVETSASIDSKNYFFYLVNKLASGTGRRLTTSDARIDFSNTAYRVHASVWPVCVKGVELTIRRISNTVFSLKELVGFGTTTPEVASLLSLTAPCDSCVMIAGNTGSGKTTTLNSLFSFVPEKERFLIVEDSPEVLVAHKNSVKLAASKKASLSHLVKDGLRMRPDRLVLGEVRSSNEVAALFDSLLSGQAKAAYFTFHAESAQHALSRLVFLGASVPDVNAVKLCVIQKRITFISNEGVVEKRLIVDLAEFEDGKALSLFKNGVLDFQLLSMSKLVGFLSVNYGVSSKEFVRLVKNNSVKFRVGL